MVAFDGLIGRPRPQRQAEAPDAPEPEGPPSIWGAVGEVRGALQVGRLLRASPFLARAPRGDGSVVLDLPGWRAGESSNALLRGYLRRLGYDAKGWGLGRNGGDAERDVETLVGRLTAPGSPPQVALVGWSLGGLIAREVARAIPERISRVVTFGTPVLGGPTFTLGASSYGRAECERIERVGRELDVERPIEVPITAIYTRRDGVVEWRACVDRASRLVEHVEVRSTHLTLGIDPDVWLATARALRQSRS